MVETSDLRSPNQQERAASAGARVQALENVWAGLNAPSPMQSFAWARACAEAFTRGELKLVTSGDPVTGLAPLFLRDEHDMLVPLGAELYEPVDFLLKDSGAAPALAEAVLELGMPLMIGDMPADSPMVEALRAACGWRRLIAVRPRAGHPYIPLDNSWLDPESHLNSGRRSDIRRARKNAEKHRPLRFEMITPTLDVLPALLDQAFRVEAANWKGEQGSALAIDSEVGNFYRQYAKAACELGQLRLAFLHLGEQPIAMQIAVEYARRFWLLKMGYDQEFSRCAPGTILMIESLRYATSQKCDVFEVLGVSEPWNQIWTKLEHPAVSIRIYRPGFRGAMDAASHLSDAGSRRIAERFKR